jgi:hypothetical protein
VAQFTENHRQIAIRFLDGERDVVRSSNPFDVSRHRCFVAIFAGTPIRAVSLALDVHIGLVRDDVHGVISARTNALGVAAVCGICDYRLDPLHGETFLVDTEDMPTLQAAIQDGTGFRYG